MSQVINADGEILVRLTSYGGRSTAAPATLTAADVGTFILVTTTGTITLPAVADAVPFVPLTIKVLVDGGVTLDGNASELIDDDLTATLPFRNTALTLVSDGSQWRIV